MSIETINTARTGLRRATSMINQSAHRLAKMNVETAPSGEQAAPDPATASLATDQISKTDEGQVGAVLTMKAGEVMYRANLKVIESTDEMLGRAADLIA